MRANSALKERNVAQIKQEMFDKTLEQILLKNNLQKIQKISSVSRIYQKEKHYRAEEIDNYFQQEMDWINSKIDKAQRKNNL